jgi:hypothetical protein
VGNRCIHGELAQLGITIAASTIWRIHNTPVSTPHGRSSDSWTTFLRSQAAGIVACDFFTVDAALLRRYYVLFFIELDRHRVHLAGITTNPTGVWTTQAARNFMMRAEPTIQFLIRDGAGQFIATFDEVFGSDGAAIIGTPPLHPGRERIRGTMGRHRWPRALRPDPHLEPPTPRTAAPRICRPLQHPPTAPQPRPTRTRQARSRARKLLRPRQRDRCSMPRDGATSRNGQSPTVTPRRTSPTRASMQRLTRAHSTRKSAPSTGKKWRTAIDPCEPRAHSVPRTSKTMVVRAAVAEPAGSVHAPFSE